MHFDLKRMFIATLSSGFHIGFVDSDHVLQINGRDHIERASTFVNGKGLPFVENKVFLRPFFSEYALLFIQYFFMNFLSMSQFIVDPHDIELRAAFGHSKHDDWCRISECGPETSGWPIRCKSVANVQRVCILVEKPVLLSQNRTWLRFCVVLPHTGHRGYTITDIGLTSQALDTLDMSITFTMRTCLDS